MTRRRKAKLLRATKFGSDPYFVPIAENYLFDPARGAVLVAGIIGSKEADLKKVFLEPNQIGVNSNRQQRCWMFRFVCLLFKHS